MNWNTIIVRSLPIPENHARRQHHRSGALFLIAEFCVYETSGHSCLVSQRTTWGIRNSVPLYEDPAVIHMNNTSMNQTRQTSDNNIVLLED